LLSFEEYELKLKDINYEHSTVKFLREFQDLIDNIREKRGAARIPRSPEQRGLPAAVRKMQLAIFSHLKTTPEITLKPQKQITFKTERKHLKRATASFRPMRSPRISGCRSHGTRRFYAAAKCRGDLRNGGKA
jgi:hypothetical protein